MKKVKPIENEELPDDYEIPIVASIPHHMTPDFK
jgi:hypothetical protein